MRWAVLFLAVLAPSAMAQELRVLSGGAAKSLVDPLAASFKGAKDQMQYQPVGKLVVIVTEETLPRLEKEGRVQRGATPIARVGIGVAVVEPVGGGEIELGIHQISEILPVKGVKLVGELPRGVLDFIDYLTGPEARNRLAQAGYTAPE